MGEVHALRLGRVPFGGTVVLAISSPVSASWLWAGFVIFLDPVEPTHHEDDRKEGRPCRAMQRKQ